jgi:hypothetical protein
MVGSEARNGVAARGALSVGTIREVAESAFGLPGGHLVDLWEQYNRLFFGGELQPILITRSRVFAWGRCIGWTRVKTCENDPYRQIQVKQFHYQVCPEQREVLLHEMVHQCLFERGQNPKHDGQPWCDEIMRISRLLGRPIWAGKYTVIREGKDTRRGNKAAPAELADLRALNQKEIAGWPYSIGLRLPECDAQLHVTATVPRSR